ncbi:MAG: ABC transporter permease [Lachnospiraceae bacterium]|nr:ABC transporter permease [Lachnospiraceae bacterium]
MRINPIVKKDLQVSSRSMRLAWGLFGYEAILAIAFLLAMLVIREESRSLYGSGNIYNSMVYLFPVIGISQLCIIALITPIITASSISGEKERQTFDVMLTTAMSPFSIVFGKVTSAVVRIMFYVLGSLPIMALSFIVGGLGWSTLLLYLLTVLLLAVFSGSIGIFCSSICRKSITAVILSFVFYFVVYGMTFLPLLLRFIMGYSDGGETLLALLWNPGAFFEEYFMLTMTGQSLLSGTHTFGKDDVGAITYWLVKNELWVYVSAGCILILTVVFMLMAAWKVNPMHSSGGRKPGKRKKEN